MSIDDSIPPTERFSNRVDDYEKYRPSYPSKVLDVLVREGGLEAGGVIADIGSGTGILSELLLANGNTVLAVEPNLQMRHAAERRLAGRSNFRSIVGVAEATTIPAGTVDMVVAAQAFHWFDPGRALAEFVRISKRKSFLGLIWNARNPKSSAFNADYEQIVQDFGSDFARAGRELVSTQTLRELLGPTLKLYTLHNEQSLDWPGVQGRLRSASYMPTPGQAGFEEMIAAARRAFDAHQQNGAARIIYETRVYLSEL